MTDLYNTIFISVSVAVCCVIINIPAALITAYICARKKFFARSFFEACICVPLVLPPVVTGYILLIVFSKNSVIGTFLSIFGIHIPFSFFAAVIAACIVSFPLVFKTLKIAITQIDPAYEHVSYTLGKNKIQTFFSIVIPMCRKALISSSLLVFARSLGEFGATIMFAGNIPGKTQTISIGMYSAFNMSNGEKTVQTLAVISIVIAFAATFVSQYINRKELI